MIETSVGKLFRAYYYSINRNKFYNMDNWVKSYGGIVDQNNFEIIRFNEDDWVVFKLIYQEYL